MSSQFLSKFPLETRRKEAKQILLRYPDRIPVIVEKSKNSNLPDLDKHKFLVPRNLTIGQFIYVIRKRIKLDSDQAVFVFINNTLPPTSALLSEIYKEHKDESGFLVVFYSSETTFGEKFFR